MISNWWCCYKYRCLNQRIRRLVVRWFPGYFAGLVHERRLLCSPHRRRLRAHERRRLCDLTWTLGLDFVPFRFGYVQIRGQNRLVDEVVDEICAEAELARITPSNEELLRIADENPIPQEWYDEE